MSFFAPKVAMNPPKNAPANSILLGCVASTRVSVRENIVPSFPQKNHFNIAKKEVQAHSTFWSGLIWKFAAFF
jgi:hypothetical protein